MRCVDCREPLADVWVSRGNGFAIFKSSPDDARAAWPSHCDDCLEKTAARVDRVAHRLMALIFLDLWAEA